MNTSITITGAPEDLLKILALANSVGQHGLHPVSVPRVVRTVLRLPPNDSPTRAHNRRSGGKGRHKFRAPSKRHVCMTLRGMHKLAKQKGWTQGDVAEQIGIHGVSLSQLKSGVYAPRKKTWFKILDVRKQLSDMPDKREDV